MASEWREYTFADMIQARVLEIGDGYRAKNSELGGDGPIFLRAGHVRDTHIDLDGVDHFRRELAGAVASKMSRPGDVLVTTKGNSTGRTSYVSETLPPVVYSPHLSYWRSLDAEVIEPGFLRYWSRSQSFRGQLAGLAASTDMAPYLSLVDQKRLRIKLPAAVEQRAIARILGTLDDKIELNRRMNETLEAIARALFKSWFVDLDPVRAKSEGRDPGLPPHLADLFPDSFEDSELGEIPKGWRVAPIGELATIVGGTTPSTKEATFWEDGGNYWATPKDLSALANPVLLETERRITDAGLAQIGSGLLPPGTVLLSSRAPIGYLAIAEAPVAINQGFIAMRPAPGVSNLFLMYWADWAQEAIVSRANGSTFLEVSKSNFRPIPLVSPSPQIFESFDRAVRPGYQRIVANEVQARALRTLRDSMLPRLISGELRVENADRFLAGDG